MRLLLALAALLVAASGCTDLPPADDAPDDQTVPGPAGSGQPECSAEVKEDSEPDGMPFGTFDHGLTNGYDAERAVRVEHLHESGCILGWQAAVLSPEVTLTLDYQDHLWDTASREIFVDDGSHHSVPVDWACSWHFAVTPSGLDDREDQHMCA